jgi:hypothetical protein
MTNETLKSCPFCGGKMEPIVERYCRHAERNGDCPIVQGTYAIEQWNTRPAPDALRVAREALEFLHGGILWRKSPGPNGEHKVPSHQMESWNVAIRDALALLAKEGV